MSILVGILLDIMSQSHAMTACLPAIMAISGCFCQTLLMKEKIVINQVNFYFLDISFSCSISACMPPYIWEKGKLIDHPLLLDSRSGVFIL